MAVKSNPFTVIKTTDETLNRVQENIRSAFSGLLSGVASGKLLTNLPLTTTTQRFAHGLGRTPDGFIRVNQDSAVLVYMTVATSTHIGLRTESGTVTADVWVF